MQLLQANKGVVIEMSTMKGILKVMPYGDEDCALPFVEVRGGEFWVNICGVSHSEGGIGTQFLDRLSPRHYGWHSLQRRRGWADFPPRSSNQQRTTTGSGHRQGGDRRLFR